MKANAAMFIELLVYFHRILMIKKKQGEIQGHVDIFYTVGTGFFFCLQWLYVYAFAMLVCS